MLIQGARLGPGSYAVDAAGQYLRNDRYFPNHLDELPLAAKVVKRDIQRRIKVSTLVLVLAEQGVVLDAPGMIADRDLPDWSVEHLGGLPAVVDREALRDMAAHLLP